MMYELKFFLEELATTEDSNCLIAKMNSKHLPSVGELVYLNQFVRSVPYDVGTIYKVRRKVTVFKTSAYSEDACDCIEIFLEATTK